MAGIKASHFNKIFIGIFLLFLCAPLLVMLATPTGQTSTTEQRHLLSLPQFHTAEQFRDDVSSYYDDQFGLRDQFIRLYRYLRYDLMGLSPADKVLLGQVGWFFYNGPQSRKYYNPQHPFAAHELQRWADALEAKRIWLSQQGIQFLFVIAPNKATVYPEFTPAWIRPISGNTKTDRLIKHLGAHTRVKVLDLRTALIAAKGKNPLYDRTDTHWNGYGAWLAATEVASYLGSPKAQQARQSGVQVARYRNPGGDLANMMGLYGQLDEETLNRYPKEPACLQRSALFSDNSQWPQSRAPFRLGCADGRGRILMFRDSFATNMAPHLGEYFEHIDFVWHAPKPSYFRTFVQRQKPQLVIEQHVERGLVDLPEQFIP